jgi:hypothetical protein
MWGTKISVLPANRQFLGGRTEFWHPTRYIESAPLFVARFTRAAAWECRIRPPGRSRRRTLRHWLVVVGDAVVCADSICPWRARRSEHFRDYRRTTTGTAGSLVATATVTGPTLASAYAPTGNLAICRRCHPRVPASTPPAALAQRLLVAHEVE